MEHRGPMRCLGPSQQRYTCVLMCESSNSGAARARCAHRCALRAAQCAGPRCRNPTLTHPSAPQRPPPLQGPSQADEIGAGYGDVPLSGGDGGGGGDGAPHYADPLSTASDPLAPGAGGPAPQVAPQQQQQQHQHHHQQQQQHQQQHSPFGSNQAAPAAASSGAAEAPLQQRYAAEAPPQPAQWHDAAAGAVVNGGSDAAASAAATDPYGTAAGAYPSVPAAARQPQPSPLAGDAAAAAAAAAAEQPPPLRISVHSPQTLRGPTGVPGVDESFTTWEVTTTTSLPSFRAPTVTVRRRFRDVVALARALPQLLPGAMLPARPARNFVEGRLRMDAAFVEARRAAVERYLNRLAAHPAAARCEALRVWLEADGALRSSPQWAAAAPRPPGAAAAAARLARTVAGLKSAAPTPAEAARPAGASRDLYRLVHERLEAMRGAAASPAAPRSPREARLLDAGALLEAQRDALSAAASAADRWARAEAGLAGAWGDLSSALEGLATFEGSYAGGGVGAPPTASLVTAARACAATRALGAASAPRLDAALQPLRDHAAALPNALAALRQRQQQQLTAATLQRDLDATRAKLQTAQLAPATMARRAEALRQEAAALEAAREAATAEYERLAERNEAELAALTAARGRELAAAAARVAEAAGGRDEQAAAGWRATAGALPLPGDVVTAYMAQRFQPARP